jgi:DNA repair exonuclease SbcCD nuclease subunit
MKVLHTADEHFSNKADKLAEVITVTDYLLERAREEQPDVAVIAGDLVDEHDGPIRIDSEAARAAINFVTALAGVCPVVIVRGTRSHDRETPYLFSRLKTTHAVHVASKIEQVALMYDNTFVPFDDGLCGEVKAVFTLIPSPDKCNLIAAFGGDSISSATMYAKEAINDMLGYLGSVNAQVPEGIPRILVAHGMITGAEYSNGSIATGDDYEYCLSDLALTNTDLKAFGHVHKQQSFHGNVFYSGSPGRLDSGEKEVKGFLIHSLEGRTLESTRFIETPAREYSMCEALWSDEGVEHIMAEVAACEAGCAGTEVRFSYEIPEENRHQVSRQDLIARFMAAGATAVKIEQIVLAPQRQRGGAGISKLESLPEKMIKYGSTIGAEIPARTLYLSSKIEGLDVAELIEDAKRAIAGATAVMPELPEDVPFGEPVVETHAALEPVEKSPATAKKSKAVKAVSVEDAAPAQSAGVAVQPMEAAVHQTVGADKYYQQKTEQLGLF